MLQACAQLAALDLHDIEKEEDKWGISTSLSRKEKKHPKHESQSYKTIFDVCYVFFCCSHSFKNWTLFVCSMSLWTQQRMLARKGVRSEEFIWRKMLRPGHMMSYVLRPRDFEEWWSRDFVLDVDYWASRDLRLTHFYDLEKKLFCSYNIEGTDKKAPHAYLRAKWELLRNSFGTWRQKWNLKLKRRCL